MEKTHHTVGCQDGSSTTRRRASANDVPPFPLRTATRGRGTLTANAIEEVAPNAMQGRPLVAIDLDETLSRQGGQQAPFEIRRRKWPVAVGISNLLGELGECQPLGMRQLE